MVDSEVLSGQLRANEIDVVHENAKKDHNIVVVNTCGFIDKAKEESVNTILDQVALKKKGRLDKVYVTGCLSQRYREDLEKEIPEVDAWFGTMELPLLLKQFERITGRNYWGSGCWPRRSIMPISRSRKGCNRTCAFCAIPADAGRAYKPPIEELVKEAEKLVKRGVKEILLIAQELTYYGLDIYKQRKLPELLHPAGGHPRTGVDPAALCLSLEISVGGAGCDPAKRQYLQLPGHAASACQR